LNTDIVSISLNYSDKVVNIGKDIIDTDFIIGAIREKITSAIV